MSPDLATWSPPIVRGSAVGGSRCAPLHLVEGNRPADLEPLVVGCYLLGHEPRPQQIVIARALLSGCRRVAVCVPRRAGKTVGLWAVVLGLCLTRPGYVVHFTAQTGLKARARWQDVVRMLETDAAHARLLRLGVTVTVYRSQGSESLTFSNGSRVLVMPPKPDAFRGEESDLWWGDEAQEFDATESLELAAAVGPTQDTRPGAIMLASGTAGGDREGLLWRWLEAMRQGVRGHGGVEYAAADGLDPDDPATWYAAHPGLAYGSTPLEAVADHHAQIALADDPAASAVSFGREYLGRWPVVTGAHLVDPVAWSDLGQLEYLERPDRGTGLVLGLDCDTHQRWASIVAAWRAGDRVALEVIRQDKGVGWVAQELYRLSRRYPDATAAWDGMPANLAATQALEKARPRVRSEVLTFPDMKQAAAATLLAVTDARLVHFHQEGLSSAAELATPRVIGDGFLFQRGGHDVTPLVAASVALLVVDRQKTRKRARISSAPPAEAAS